MKLKAGTFFADRRRIEKPKPNEQEKLLHIGCKEDKQVDVGNPSLTKTRNLEGIEGTAVSSRSGPAPPIVAIRMRSGRDEDSVIIGLHLFNVTLIVTTADL